MSKLFVVHTTSKISNIVHDDKPDFYWAKHKKQLRMYINKSFRTDIYYFDIQEVKDITDWSSEEWDQMERGMKIKRLKNKNKI